MDKPASLSPDVWEKTPPEARALIEDLAHRVEELSRPRPVVISLHGIRTRGKWQKDLGSDLSAAGMIVESLDYGFFWALQLLWPPSRRKKIDWFRDEYERVCQKFNVDQLSIVAHSFGTYIVAGAIETYHLKFDRVVLCGSIVRQDYPWNDRLAGKDVGAVLNDFGHTDFWARVVAYGVKDAGQSGLRGFGENANQILQRGHPKWRHSDYFHAQNYRDIWIPFLQGRSPSPLPATPKPAVNRKFRLVIVAFLLLVGAFAVWWWFIRPPNPSGWKKLPGSTVAVPVAVMNPVETDAAAHRMNAIEPSWKIKPEDPYLVFDWFGDHIPTRIALKHEFEQRARLGHCLATNETSGSHQDCTIQVTSTSVKVPAGSGTRLRLVVFPFDNEFCQQLKRQELNEFFDITF